jgi:uncharacterized protein (TIGR01777 family)
MNASKTVLVSGATGLVGRALCAELKLRGHAVRTLSRSHGDVRWDVAAGTMDVGALDGVDSVVHLAGESVVQRWTVAAKARILESRVCGAELLSKAILEQQNPPSYISASGVNFYGYDCGQGVDETTPSGAGFLAEVCRQWEGAAQPLIDAGVRSVFVRIGVVLSAEGGALPKMLTPFKLGLGGRIGTGRQYMSWISLTDLVSIFCLAIEDDELVGPINATSPMPVTNGAFTKALGSVLGRPTVCPVPRLGLRLLFGRMGEETIGSNVGVYPRRLEATGFTWQDTDLAELLSGCID